MYPTNSSSTTFSFSNIFAECKTSLRLAVPMIATEVIYTLNGFFATMMVAHLGKEELAANALVWGIYLTVVVFFIGIFSAVSIMVSHSFGAKDTNGISICFKQGVILALLCILPMMFILWLSPVVLTWTGQDPKVIYYAKPLFHAFSWSIIFLNLLFVIDQFLVGLSKVYIVTISAILIVPLQILFYYILVFGKLGLPHFGLVGIGYSNILAHALIVTFFIIYLKTAKQLKIYNLFTKWWLVNKKFLGELIRVGYPLGIMYCIELALFAAVSIMMGKLGTDILAAYQISYQFLMIPLSILFALTQTTGVRVGTEVGRNNRNTVKLAARVNLSIGLIFASAFSIFYISFPHLIIGIDINIHAPHLQLVVKTATLFLSLVAIIILTDSIRLITFGALRALKDTKFPMFNSIVGFWFIAFPLAYLLAFKYKFGGAGIWWGMIIGLFIAGIILFIRFNYLVKSINLESLVTKSDENI